MNALTLIQRNAGIIDVIIDLPNEKVNKFSSAFLMEFNDLISQIENRDDIKLLRFISNKESIFIAGADISEIENIYNEDDAEYKAKAGQDLFNRIEDLPFTTLSVINGACLGGGLEFALACDYRMASTHPKVKLGLPEVSLGIIPGFGGTYRLPRLIGIQNALELILSATVIDAKKAFQKKLIDFCVAHEFLDQRIEEFSQKLLSQPAKRKISGRREKPFSQKLLEDNPLGRLVLFDKAKSNILIKTNGHYPAPLMALEVIKNNFDKNRSEALKIERRGFAQLAPTPLCKNLINIYFASEQMKKESWGGLENTSHKVNSSSVLGAGIMGGGIAWLLSNKNFDVRMKDISLEAVQKGFEAAAKVYEGYVKRRKLKPSEVSMKMNKISSSLDFVGFKNRDICIEAVVENIDIKKKVLSEVEQHSKDDSLLVSNTSSLSITEMASVLKRKENFMGMHFFNPVDRMPLVEIIPHQDTSPEALSRVVVFSQALGKVTIVVKDVPGFLVNRILIPYINEAVLCYEETGSFIELDKSLKAFGMPMGPFTLADEVGLDVGYKVSKILDEAYGPRMAAAKIMKLMIEKKFLGKKNTKGFYKHEGRIPLEINAELDLIHREFVHNENKTIKESNIEVEQKRCLFQLINESARCIEEKVISKVEYLDLAMIYGTGFPPFLGGPLRYADSLGLENVLDTLNHFEQEFGMRFKPAQIIMDLAKQNKKFYEL